MRLDHPETLNISMIRRRIPGIDGYAAALMVEASRWLLTDSLAMRARRNGRRVM